MKAIQISAPGRVLIRELEQPQPGPGEVLIRSSTVGICGSDVEIYQGRIPQEYCRYPVIPGHEWSGEVAALGEGVRGIQVGNKVVAEGFLACGTCANCRDGATSLCERGYDEIGFTQPGGLAQYVVVPARQIHILPDATPLDEAALLEPTAVVAQAFLQKAPRPGDVVVILGDGAISLLAVEIARLYSPSAIIVSGRHESRLALSREIGATHTINQRQASSLELVNDLTHGRGADLVFEGAGRAQAVSDAFAMAKRGGTVLLEGIAGDSEKLDLATDIFALKQLSVHDLFGASTRAWAHAVSLLRTNQLHLTPLITHRFPLEQYEDALKLLAARQVDTLKVVIQHEGSI